MPEAVMVEKTSAELAAENEKLQKQLDEQKDNGGGDSSSADDKTADNKVADDKPADDKPADDKPADDKTADNKMSEASSKKFSEMEAENKTLKENAKKTEDNVKQLNDRNRKSEVELAVKQFAEDGVPPAVIKVAKECMLADTGRTYRFNETDKDGKVEEQNLTLSDCINAVVDAIPTIELGEETDSQVDGDGDVGGNEKDKEDTIKKYMEANKCDYTVALKKCYADGKIEKRFAVAAEA